MPSNIRVAVRLFGRLVVGCRIQWRWMFVALTLSAISAVLGLPTLNFETGEAPMVLIGSFFPAADGDIHVTEWHFREDRDHLTFDVISQIAPALPGQPARDVNGVVNLRVQTPSGTTCEPYGGCDGRCSVPLGELTSVSPVEPRYANLPVVNEAGFQAIGKAGTARIVCTVPLAVARPSYSRRQIGRAHV